MALLLLNIVQISEAVMFLIFLQPRAGGWALYNIYTNNEEQSFVCGHFGSKGQRSCPFRSKPNFSSYVCLLFHHSGVIGATPVKLRH